jgi:hypothetical protein
MKRLLLMVMTIVMALLFAAPALAQDGTPIFNFQWTFERVMIAALLLVVVIQQFALYKSSPPAFIKLFFGFLKEQAAQTPATWDDEVVSFGEETYGKMANQQSQAQTARQVTASGNLPADMATIRSRADPPAG